MGLASFHKSSYGSFLKLSSFTMEIVITDHRKVGVEMIFKYRNKQSLKDLSPWICLNIVNLS